MADVTMTVLAPGHIRVNVGEASVEILSGDERLYVAAFPGAGWRGAMTYGTRPTSSPALEQARPKPAPLPVSRSSVPGDVSPAPEKSKARKHLPWGTHVPGTTAPNQNNPVRYAMVQLRKRVVSASASKLAGFLSRIKVLTGMDIAPQPGESLEATHHRAMTEANLWFEAYCVANNMQVAYPRIVKRRRRSK